MMKERATDEPKQGEGMVGSPRVQCLGFGQNCRDLRCHQMTLGFCFTI